MSSYTISSSESRIEIIVLGSVVASLEFECIGDTVYVSMIESLIKRSGYATMLVSNLVDLIGHQNIDWGVCSEEGTLFRNSLYHSGLLDIQHIHLEQQVTRSDLLFEITSFCSYLGDIYGNRARMLAQSAISMDDDGAYSELSKVVDSQVADEIDKYWTSWKSSPTPFPDVIIDVL